MNGKISVDKILERYLAGEELDDISMETGEDVQHMAVRLIKAGIIGDPRKEKFPEEFK